MSECKWYESPLELYISLNEWKVLAWKHFGILAAEIKIYGKWLLKCFITNALYKKTPALLLMYAMWKGLKKTVEQRNVPVGHLYIYRIKVKGMS